jgi:hypothetical protein
MSREGDAVLDPTKLLDSARTLLFRHRTAATLVGAVLVISFVLPAPHSDRGPVPAAATAAPADASLSAGAEVASAVTGSTVVPEPPVATFAGLFGAPPVGAPASAPTEESPSAATSSAPGPTTTLPAPKRPLTIIASGYSSRTGGTPAEQEPPNNGLPVAAAGDQDAKRSFIKLSGDATRLRLTQVTDANQNINADAAALKICPITAADWKPARGQALDSGPTFDDGACQLGTRKDASTWDFDLTRFGQPGAMSGFAITRAAGPTGNSFQVVFSAITVPVDQAP